MRVVALVSGGKDSSFNMMQCVAAGHEIVALANLYPVEKGTFSKLHLDKEQKTKQFNINKSKKTNIHKNKKIKKLTIVSFR